MPGGRTIAPFAAMLIYYASLQAIEQQSRQLCGTACHHCGKTCNLLSHGYIRKKQHGGQPLPVGKRVFCSNRRSHDGCGRTIRLFLDNAIRGLHASADQVSAFVLALAAGVAVARAYLLATGGPARNAWRWIGKMQIQLPPSRSLAHQPPRPVTAAGPTSPRYRHQTVLRTTLAAWCGEHEAQSPCRALQRRRQQAFM